MSIEALGELLKTEPQITKVVLAMCEKYPEVAWLTSKTNVTPEGIINNKVLPQQQHSLILGSKTLCSDVWRDSHRV